MKWFIAALGFQLCYIAVAVALFFLIRKDWPLTLAILPYYPIAVLMRGALPDVFSGFVGIYAFLVYVPAAGTIVYAFLFALLKNSVFTQ